MSENEKPVANIESTTAMYVEAGLYENLRQRYTQLIEENFGLSQRADDFEALQVKYDKLVKQLEIAKRAMRKTIHQRTKGYPTPDEWESNWHEIFDALAEIERGGNE